MPQWRGGGPHLSGLEADGLQGSKGQVALVGELGEPADDPVTQFTFITYRLLRGWSRVHRPSFEQPFHPLALGSQ